VEDDGGEQGFDVWDLISSLCSPVMVQKDVEAFLTHVRALLPLPLSSKGRKQLTALLMITACCLTCRSASHDFAKQSVLHMFKDLTMLLDQRQRAACWGAVFRRFCWPSHDIDARASSAHVEVLSAVAGVFLEEEEEDEAPLRQMWLLLYDAYLPDRTFVTNWCRLLQSATRASLTLSNLQRTNACLCRLGRFVSWELVQDTRGLVARVVMSCLDGVGRSGTLSATDYTKLVDTILDWSEIFGKLTRFHELTDLYGRELLLAVLYAVKETLSPLFWGWLDTEVVMSRIHTILQVCSMACHVNWVHSLHSFSADRGVRLLEHVGMTMFWKLQHGSASALHECERVRAMKSCLQLVRTVHTLQFMDVEEEVVECAPFSTREMDSFAAKTLECARADLNPDMLDLAGLVLSVLSFGSPEVDTVRDSMLLLQSASDGGCCASLVGGIAACLVTLTKRSRADLDGLVHKLLTIADTQLEWTRDVGHTQAAKDVLTLARGHPRFAVSFATKVLGAAAAAVQEKTCRNLVASKVAIDVVHKVFSAGDAWELSSHDGRVLIMALLRLTSLSRHVVVEFLGFRCLHIFETLRLSGVLLSALCDPDVVLALADCMVSSSAHQPCEDARQLFHVFFPDALLLVLDGPIRQNQMVMHRLVFDALPAVAARRGLPPRQGSVHELVTALQPWKDMVSREWSCSRQAWCCAVVLSMRRIALTFFC
jgi:hypothetical protein